MQYKLLYRVRPSIHAGLDRLALYLARLRLSRFALGLNFRSGLTGNEAACIINGRRAARLDLVELVDCHDHVHPRHHLAKDRVTPIEVWRGRDDNREVATIRIWPHVGCTQQSRTLMAQLEAAEAEIEQLRRENTALRARLLEGGRAMPPETRE